MNDANRTNYVGWRKRSPPLSEETEIARIGDVFGGVGDGMVGVEFGWGEGAEGAGLVGGGDWVRNSPGFG